MTTTVRTYELTERYAATEETDATHLVRRETVYATGRVDVVVTGREGGERINQTATRHHGPLDMDRVHVARLKSGWRAV